MLYMKNALETYIFRKQYAGIQMGQSIPAGRLKREISKT